VLSVARVLVVWPARLEPWTVGMVLMVVVEVANLAVVIGSGVPGGLFKPILLLGVVTALVALRDQAARARVFRPLSLVAALLAVYLGTQAAAVLVSRDVALAEASLRSRAIDCMFILVVVALAVLSGRPWTLALAIVVPFVALSALAVISLAGHEAMGTFGGLATVVEAPSQAVTKLRQAGPLGDANFWGRHLVIAVPLALALLCRAGRAGSHRRMIVWAGSVVVLFGGIYLTQSRGTFLAAAAAVLVWLVASGPTVRRWGVRALPLTLPLLLLPGIGARLGALVSELWGSASTYDVDYSVLGRRAGQEIAFAMFRDRPLFGFGPGGYESLAPSYAGKVATAVIERMDDPHNLYLQLAAESGLFGLAGWLVMISGFFAMALGAVHRLAGGPRSGARAPDRQLAAAALAGLVAWSLASVFLHLAYLRTLGVLLAMVACVAALSVEAGDGATPMRVRPSPRRARAASAAVVTGVVVVAVVAVVAATATTRFVAMRTVTLAPVGPVNSYYFWAALEIRSRNELLPTYAAMIVPGGDGDVQAKADPVRGVITVSATAPNPVEARAQLADAMAAATDRMAVIGADRAYTLRQVGVDEEEARRGPSGSGVLFGVLGGAGVPGLGLLVAAAVRRRGRRSGGLLRRAVRLGRTRSADRDDVRARASAASLRRM